MHRVDPHLLVDHIDHERTLDDLVLGECGIGQLTEVAVRHSREVSTQVPVLAVDAVTQELKGASFMPTQRDESTGSN